MPERVWDLPDRVQRANAAGPRFNQSELAQACGVVQSVISKLANRVNLYGLRLDTIFKLAEALDVSVCWLLGGSTKVTPGGPANGASRRRAKATGKRRNAGR